MPMFLDILALFRLWLNATPREVKCAECETAEPSRRRRWAATHERTGEKPQNSKSSGRVRAPNHKGKRKTSLFDWSYGADYGVS